MDKDWRDVTDAEIDAMKAADLKAATKAMLAAARDDAAAAPQAVAADLTADQLVRYLGFLMAAPDDHGGARASKRQARLALDALNMALQEQTGILGRNVECEAHRILLAVFAKYRDAMAAVIER